MPRDLRNEREFAIRCNSDACWQGRRPCPFPTVCETPEPITPGENAEVWATLVIACIGIGATVALISGWFA